MTARTEKVGLGYKVSKGMPWLDTIAATMQQAFEPVLGEDAPRGPRDFLYGTWLGHSITMKLSREQFLRMLYALMIASGSSLIIRALAA